MSETITSLQAALAGESQAHVKYRYFANIARAEGFEEIAKHFEHTADQELRHAWSHLDLLIKKPLTTKQCLEMAIEGETYEFEVMYPEFREIAQFEGSMSAVDEANHQIEESQRHASEFNEILKKAEKRFAALTKVEQRHAEAYQNKLDELNNGVQ